MPSFVLQPQAASAADLTAPLHLSGVSFREARDAARQQPGRGVVYLLHRGHWSIVANYADGRVWNGQSQIVPSPENPAEDWRTLAAG